jgi:hypothetical protein
MSFFEPPPPPPTMAPAEHRPPWLAPPVNVLPGVVPVELLIARTEDTAVAVTGIRAYPTGFAFTVSIRLRRPLQQEQTHSGPGILAMLDYLQPSGQVGEAFLRFGVRFADGRKATNLHGIDLPRGRRRPKPPVLTEAGGGGGGERDWDSHQWLWGVPPPGPLAFACEWPVRQIAESQMEIDAQLVLDAAERAVTLWPDD